MKPNFLSKFPEHKQLSIDENEAKDIVKNELDYCAIVRSPENFKSRLMKLSELQGYLENTFSRMSSTCPIIEIYKLENPQQITHSDLLTLKKYRGEKYKESRIVGKIKKEKAVFEQIKKKLDP